MMTRDCKPLTELHHIQMDTSTGEICKTKTVKIQNMINFDNYINDNK